MKGDKLTILLCSKNRNRSDDDNNDEKKKTSDSRTTDRMRQSEVKRVKPGLEQLFRKGKQIYATDWLNTITNTCVNTIFASTKERERERENEKKSGTHAISKIGHLNIYGRNRPTRLTIVHFIFKGYELLLNNLSQIHSIHTHIHTHFDLWMRVPIGLTHLQYEHFSPW